MIEWISVRGIALWSILIYYAFDYWDSKRLKDEREALIHLKSLELAHKATLGTISLIAVLHVARPEIDDLYVIPAVIVAALYSEILGKLYYRRKL